ncbi:MAG: hypothetical protein QGG40_08235, partial [Myxococcota bacterium]|nr:hypothetical protein [Myxococcota bacterium]
LLWLVACGGSETQDEVPVDDPCPAVDLARLGGDWIRVQGGSRADPKYRFRVLAQGSEAEPSYEAWYVGGYFGKLRMRGRTRDRDVVFDEVPTSDRQAAFDAGEASLTRLYVEPRKEKCSLRVNAMRIERKDGKERETPVETTPAEYLPFPEGQPFTFRPCDEPVFLGEAARKRATAMSQLEAAGGPDPVHTLGEAIPVGAWSDVAADGDPACSYDMDLFFDDRPVQDGQARPASVIRLETSAGPVLEGSRSWFVEAWSAPYSGNHHFEIYRYRTCSGAERELLGVACLEAVLE